MAARDYFIDTGDDVFKCRICLRTFRARDRSGRRNWFGLVSHIGKHVRDATANLMSRAGEPVTEHDVRKW